jgi:heme/copper-type cytochrome/quinol oxidase subunit 2
MNLARLKKLVAAALVALVLCPHSLLACAACYGQSDSAMAKGMNWGIMSLLAVVVCVLGGITTFFVYIAKKSPTDKPE